MYRRTEGGVWYFTVGRVRKSSGTTDKRRAEKLRDKERAKYWDAEKLGVKPARSWQQCVVEWARRKSEKASWKDDQSRLKWWHTHLGHIEDVRTITRQMVDGLLRTHRGARDDIRVSANATANRYAAVVGGILNMVCQELQWIDASPRMPHYPETKGRERWLSSEEWYRLYEALPAHLKAPAMFSIATGMRQSKVLGLEWGQINIVGRWLSFDGTDNKLGNVIPLNETAMRALEMARTAKVVDATHVWLYRDKPFTKPKVGWYNALKETVV